MQLERREKLVSKPGTPVHTLSSQCGYTYSKAVSKPGWKAMAKSRLVGWKRRTPFWLFLLSVP
jgi:hypothetical protein